MKINFIPVGYQGIKPIQKPEWIVDDNVKEIWSVANCMNGLNIDWINQWMHNGYWHYNSIHDLRTAYLNCGLKNGYQIIYMENYKYAYDNLMKKLVPIWIEESFTTNVVMPEFSEFIGYDVVSFSGRTMPEHSIMSCNNMSKLLHANKYCLTEMDPEIIIKEISDYKDVVGEPGPYKIYSIYKIAKQVDALAPASPVK